jgi:hypothetical protein
MKMERSWIGLGIAVVAAVVMGLLLVVGISETPAHAQSPAYGDGSAAQNVTYLAVEFADGTRSGRRITWDTAPARPEALRSAGFEVEEAFGTVCSIDGEGCPASDCFCPDNWWSNSVWSGGVWDLAFPPPPVADGDVLGFRNGPPPATWGPPEWPAYRFTAVADAMEYLRPFQSADDGSYPAPFDPPSATTDQVFAVSANRGDPGAWARDPDGPSLIDYLWSSDAFYYPNLNAASSAKMEMAYVAARAMAGDRARVCWHAQTKRVMDYYVPTAGTFYTVTKEQSYFQAFAVLALKSTSETVPVSATQVLSGMVQADGGWEFMEGFGSDAQSTAMALEALLADGVPTSTEVVSNGLDFLKGQQMGDGGIAYQDKQYGSDVNATAFAVQAIVAAGQDPISGTWRILSDTLYTSPISYLLDVQLPDGSFPSFSPMLATQLALPALLERPFPLVIAQVDACLPVYLPTVVYDGP